MKVIIHALGIALAALVLAACTSTPANPIVGSWNVSVDTPTGVQQSVWNISADGSGAMVGAQGSQPMTMLVMEGNSLRFTVDINAGGQTLSLRFAGNVQGDALNGEFSSDFGAAAVTGTRQ